MDYQKHYDRLCERAKNRVLEGYTERHHIIPKCMGGDDSPENLVDLTPEEHYVAHQLLVKIYPNHSGLIWAAIQMSGNSKGHSRNNKLYGWLRRKNQRVAKQRTGKKNGSYGKPWYYHPVTLESIKCFPDAVPEGFVKGRVRVKSAFLKRRQAEEERRLKKKEFKPIKYTDEEILETIDRLQTTNISEIAREIGVAQPHTNTFMRRRIRACLDQKCVSGVNGVPFTKLADEVFMDTFLPSKQV